MGVGRAELRATVTFDEVEAAETCVEAAAPVRTRATTAVRTIMLFIMMVLGLSRKIIYGLLVI